MKAIKEFLYYVGMFLLYMLVIIQVSECFKHKITGDDIYTLVLYAICFYALITITKKDLKW